MNAVQKEGERWEPDDRVCFIYIQICVILKSTLNMFIGLWMRSTFKVQLLEHILADSKITVRFVFMIITMVIVTTKLVVNNAILEITHCNGRKTTDWNFDSNWNRVFAAFSSILKNWEIWRINFLMSFISERLQTMQVRFLKLLCSKSHKTSQFSLSEPKHLQKAKNKMLEGDRRPTLSDHWPQPNVIYI